MPSRFSAALDLPFGPAAVRGFQLRDRLRRWQEESATFTASPIPVNDEDMPPGAGINGGTSADVKLPPWVAQSGGRVLAGLLATTALAGAAAAGVGVYARANHDEVVARHERLLDEATAVRFFNSSSTLIGAAPQPGVTDRRMILRVKTMPQAFAPILVQLEDKYAAHRSWRHWYGVDIVAAAKAPICALLRPALTPVLGHRARCASSSLLMEAVRGSFGEVGGRGHGRALAERKIREILDAWSLSVDGGPLEPSQAAFIADRLTYATGEGGSIWGLETAAEVLFGVPADRLTLAQQAILAAAVRVPVRLTCPGDDPRAQTAAAARWQAIQKRALFGLFATYKAGDPAAISAKAQILSMAPLQAHALSPDFVQALSRQEACLVASNLGERAGVVGGAAVLAAQPELVELRRKTAGPITAVRLTVDLKANKNFRAEIEAALTRMQHDQAARLTTPMAVDQLGHAEVMLAVSDADGAVRLMYANTVRNMLDEPRRGGSIGKLPVALAAAQAGRRVEDPLCDLQDTITHVRSDNGDAGYRTCKGPALMTWAKVYGQSLNVPALALARELGDQTLRPAASAFGFQPGAGPGLAHDLVTGEVPIVPRRAMAAMTALRLGIGGEPAAAALPYIVAAVETKNGWSAPDHELAVDLSPYLATPAARQLLGVAAGSALRVPGGTLVGAAAQTPVSPVEVGKTGTVAGPRPEALTVEKLVVGSGAGDSRSTYFGLLQARSGALGHEVSALPLWIVLRRWAARGATPVGQPEPPKADFPDQSRSSLNPRSAVPEPMPGGMPDGEKYAPN